MNTHYRRLRHAGMTARESLATARAIEAFGALERDGVVRLRVESEDDDYFDVYGEPETERERLEIQRMIDRDGCWYAVSEFMTPWGAWETADGVGMLAGYANTESPFENWYIGDLMRAAVDGHARAWEEAGQAV